MDILNEFYTCSSNIVPVYMNVDYSNVAIRYAIENDLCINSIAL